jgi:rhamnogalacturonyl hydrolase YesR
MRDQRKNFASIYLKQLQIDKRFLAKEQDWNDIVYVAKMIMIYAAAEYMPKILEEAPSFFGKHLNYLKDKYTEFFTHSNNHKMQIANVELVECDQPALVSRAHSQLLDRFA